MADLDRLKLKFTPWHCDKEPYGFVSFMQSNTAVMRSLNCGAAIEDYLDIKLGRTAVQDMMVSSIINDDPDFARPIEMPAQAESQGEATTGDTELLYSSVSNTASAAPASTVSGQSKKSQATTILPSAGSYYSLSTGARQLDVMMYSVLLCNVIGTKRCVIECVKEHSYIQGMCLLYKHCDITRNDRISRAFTGMDNIRFGGDAQVWATTCIMSHRELHDSKASMRHYSLQKIMHSLDGKAKTVQYRIAEDMNALSADDTINIYDLIQEYASMIASVGDSSPKPVMGVQDDLCHNCGEKGHHANTCTNQNNKDHQGDNRNGNNGKPKKKCTHCGWKGHTVEECRKKAKEVAAAAVAAVNAVHAGSANGSQPASQPTNSSQPAPPVTQSSLAAYLASLSPGGSGSSSGSGSGGGSGNGRITPDTEQAAQVLFTQQAGSDNDLQLILQSPPYTTFDLSTAFAQSTPSLPSAVSLLLDNADLSHHHLSFQREMICARSVGLLGDEELEELGLTQPEMIRFYAHRQQTSDNLQLDNLQLSDTDSSMPDLVTDSDDTSSDDDSDDASSRSPPDPTPAPAADSSRDTAFGPRGDAHIGEASHPGPSVPCNTRRQSPPSMINIFMLTVACVISVCDGMGCGLMALQDTLKDNSQFDTHRYLACEISDDAKKIATNANPVTDKFHMDHSWHSNAWNITEADIAALGYNSVKMFLSGPPCQDFSRLRLLVKKSARKTLKQLRPGLEGPEGKLFIQIIQILQWILKYNPDCEFLIECVNFKDMEDWKIICAALGIPLEINAQYYSFTKRNRAYWTNIATADHMLPPTSPPLDPNTCMGEGRTLIQYEACGRLNVRPIGASWKNGKSTSGRPVMVKDIRFEQPQHLTLEEAQKLMGMLPGCTAGNGATVDEQLTAIGNGWDMNVVRIILSRSKLCSSHQENNTSNEEAKHAMLTMQQHLSPDKMAEVLMELEPELRQQYISLLSQQHTDNSAITDDQQDAAGRIPTAYGHMTNEQIATFAIVATQEALTPDALASCLLSMDSSTKDWFLSLLTAYHSQSDNDCSVLDSGSSRHLQDMMCVTNSDDKTPLAGFNGSTQWTEGNGYLPATMQDGTTGEHFKVDIDDTDLMSKNLVSKILSLGKLLREGWDFHFTDRGSNCTGTTPGGAHTVEVMLGLDDILRVSHKLRTGADKAPLPVQPQLSPDAVHSVKRSAADATASFLHDTFFHRSAEKIFRTIGVTKGYELKTRLPDHHCNTCAQCKARNFGLSQKRLAMPVLDAPDHDPVFDDDNNLDADDYDPEEPSELIADNLEYIAPVAGRQLGEQNVPRFDLEKLRPFEAVFVDNKDYSCDVRGGAVTTLIFIDYKTRTKHKIDLHNKTLNGSAFRIIVAREGIHKLPYSCRVYTDGCGSMKHVRDTASSLGIDHQFIPPHQQSLNEAEKVADTIWADARAAITHHNAPDHFFSLMVDYAMYTDIRTATTASREWKTPYELSRGAQPSIIKLHRPFTKCFVQVPKSKRKQLASKGLHHIRAEPGRFVGFHSPYSSTYAVMLDPQYKGQQDRLVHSINVTFDDNDCTIGKQPQAPSQLPASPEIDARYHGASAEEANDECHDEQSSSSQNPLYSQLNTPVPDRDEHFDTGDPSDQAWFMHPGCTMHDAGPTGSRPRPSKGHHTTRCVHYSKSKLRAI